MAAELALVTDGLGRDYGASRAVDELDLEVRAGEFFGFLGPNGAGKTTTIRMLTTLLRPTRGRATVAGYDIEAAPLEVRRRIGVVFQETTLDLDLTADENLRYCTRLYGLSRAESAVRIDEALELFGLVDRRRDRVRTFSGGMRRALDLARGILHRPSILFLDEPTLGLDPGHRREIWAFLRRLCSESGTTLMLTTHYLEEADPCDRVVIVDRGKVVVAGTPEELRSSLGRESVELVTAAPEVYRERVEQLTGLVPQRDDHGLTVFTDDAGPVIERLLPLRGEGVELRLGRPSLEDVFVAVTRGTDS
jgi:ABC-2 type transport system ATP-binding protein